MTLDDIADREAEAYGIEPFRIELEIPPADVDDYLWAKAFNPDLFIRTLIYPAPRAVLECNACNGTGWDVDDCTPDGKYWERCPRGCPEDAGPYYTQWSPEYKWYPEYAQ